MSEEIQYIKLRLTFIADRLREGDLEVNKDIEKLTPQKREEALCRIIREVLLDHMIYWKHMNSTRLKRYGIRIINCVEIK